MDIQKAYAQIIDQLKNDGRGFVKLTNEEIDFLNNSLTLNTSPLELEQIFCILAHDLNFHPQICEKLFEILPNFDHKSDKDLIIFGLSALRRHHFEARSRLGDPVTTNYLKIIEMFLLSKEAELVEWSLRSIEELGGQGRYFIPHLKKIEPTRFSLIFNTHKRHIYDILNILKVRFKL